MIASELEIESERVRRLVLARLLSVKRAPLKRDVIRAVSKAISPPLSKAAADKVARQALESCERVGYIEGEKPKLTAAGERAVLGLFGVSALPKIRSWEHGQQLAALSSVGRTAAALGDARSKYTRGKEGLSADDLAGVVLAAEHALPESVQTLEEAVDRLAWRALGEERDEPFTIERVQRHLLRGLVAETTRGNMDTFRRQVAMRAVGARGHDAKSLTRALLFRRAKPIAAPRPRVAPAFARNDNAASARTPQPSLTDFAVAVREAARSPQVSRFHEDRAFIGSIWEHMRGRSPIGDMSLAEFKATLIRAHRERLLRISRASFVRALDPDEVRRSEARYHDATFHFVALDTGGIH